MKSANDCSFIYYLSEMGLTHAQKAIALLWYEDYYCETEAEATIAELADTLESTGLSGQINKTVLRRNLSESSSTVQGADANSFRIALADKPNLDEKFLHLLSRPKPAVSDSFLPNDVIGGTHDYLEKLGRQVNGCYCYGFYDACAVMCRRMIESLLIDAFDNEGNVDAIKRPNGDFVGLDDIIGKARSGQFIDLPRGTGEILDKIKQIGDTAAHDRYHIAPRHDIDEFSAEFRRVVSQLLAIAGIKS